MSTHVANQQDHDLIDQLGASEAAALVQCAGQLFAGSVTIERSVDPDDPAAVYAVFRVALTDPRPTIDEIIDRELAWHREAAQVAPRARGLVRLLVE
jgi:hypothetical protein